MKKHVSLLSVEEPLRAPLEIGFDYTRSLGPVLGEFMTALAGRRGEGHRVVLERRGVYPAVGAA